MDYLIARNPQQYSNTSLTSCRGFAFAKILDQSSSFIFTELNYIHLFIAMSNYRRDIKLKTYVMVH